MLRYALAALLIASVSGPVAAQRGPDGPVASRLSSQMFARKARAGDQFEIISSQLALSRSRNPQIRSYARRLIADHRANDRQLRAIITGAGLRLPPARPDAEGQMLLQHLRAVPPREFNQAFIETQVDAHQNAIDLYRTYASRGQQPQLRRFAEQQLPVLREHFQMGQRLDRRLSAYRPPR